jgi:hypothetical protein
MPTAAPEKYVLNYPAAQQFCPPVESYFDDVARREQIEATRLERPEILIEDRWLKPGCLLVTYGWKMAVDPATVARADKIVVAPNGVDMDLFGSPLPADASFAKSLGLADAVEPHLPAVAFQGSIFTHRRSRRTRPLLPLRSCSGNRAGTAPSPSAS